MNLKSAEASRFPENDLLPQVEEKLRLTSNEERARLETEPDAALKSAGELGGDPDGSPVPAIEELRHAYGGRTASETFIVCLTGAECSGKTTLAEALAHGYKAPLVPEAARGWLQRRGGQAPGMGGEGGPQTSGPATYAAADVLAIAREQIRLERAALAEAPPLLICDTDLLVIQVWWKVKYEALPDELRQASAERSPRAYLLTRPDIPWVPDPLRESGGDRDGLHLRYRRLLAGGGCPYAELGGDRSARLAAAKSAIDGWLTPS